MAGQIRKRDEIEAKYKWRLTDIYPSDEAWQEAFDAAVKEVKAFAAFDGKVSEDPRGIIRRYFTVMEQVNTVVNYAFLRKETDNADPAAQAIHDRAMALMVKAETASAFLQPELLMLDDSVLDDMMQDPDMADFHVFLHSLKREKPHTLNKEQERLLAMMGDLAQSSDNIYTMLTSVDMNFPDVVMPDGTKQPLTEGTFSSFLHDRCRETRKQAFEGIMSTYGSFGNTIAGTYGASVKKDQFYADARLYPSAVEASLFGNEIPLSVYDNLISVIHDALPTLNDYLRLRKERLGLDEMHMYDLYCPIVPNFDMDLPYEKAFDLVLEGLTPMGEDYVAMLREARDKGWIDVFPSLNKSSGAFSDGSLRHVHPYVLLNHNNNLDSAMTIAHELGHSMHSWFSNKAQPFPMADYSLFVAEVASTCNECVMMRHLLKTLPGKDAQAYLLNHFMEQFRTTVFRQTMFAEFERISHDMAAKDEPLTREALNAAYYALNQKYYGESCVVDEVVANEWMRIPHFYRAFYVYVYATGLCAAVSLSERILNEGEPAVRDYRKFLSAGSSVPPIEALKLAGIDMSSPEPIRKAMKVFAETIAQFKAL